MSLSFCQLSVNTSFHEWQTVINVILMIIRLIMLGKITYNLSVLASFFMFATNDSKKSLLPNKNCIQQHYFSCHNRGSSRDSDAGNHISYDSDHVISMVQPLDAYPDLHCLITGCGVDLFFCHNPQGKSGWLGSSCDCTIRIFKNTNNITRTILPNKP